MLREMVLTFEKGGSPDLMHYTQRLLGDMLGGPSSMYFQDCLMTDTSSGIPWKDAPRKFRDKSGREVWASLLDLAKDWPPV